MALSLKSMRSFDTALACGSIARLLDEYHSFLADGAACCVTQP